MRKAAPLIALLPLLFLPACRTAGTYAERGEHIEIMRQILEDYASASWFAYSQAYADTAGFYVNALETMDLEARLAAHRASRDVFVDVAITDPLFGEVNNEDGDTWVLTWGLWTGRVTQSDYTVSVPIHIATQFEGGKAVQEWTYMNLSPLENAIIEAGTVFGTLSIDDDTAAADPATPPPADGPE